MERRTFVAAVGVGMGVAVAGCLSDDPDERNDPADGGENGTDGSANETDDPGDGTDETPTDGGEDPPNDGNDSDGTEGDNPNGEDDGDDPGEKLDGTGYTVSLKDGPVEEAGKFTRIRIELVDPYIEPGSPAALEAVLSNDSEGKVEVSSSAPSPFGVLWAEPDGGGESITLWNDAYQETDHVGTDGKRVKEVEDIGLVEEIEAGESITQTFEIHEETPGLGAGTYTAAVSCRIETAGGGVEADLALAIERGLSELENGDNNGNDRIDEPPYKIEEPEPPDDPENPDWNEDYLGEEMPAEPSLEFEELDGVRLETWPLSIRNDEGDQYAVDLVESESNLEERFDLEAMGPEDQERIGAIDFDERMITVVESGFGSGSVRHRWKRVEESGAGIHLHGYYTQPYERTDDYTSRQSALVVERPDGGLELARASLTVSPERRIRFDSTEGVVTVDPEDG